MSLGILDLLGVAHQPDLGTEASRASELAHAVDCYRYLLRTAPPFAIERAHTEAMLQLEAAQRRQFLQTLCRQLPKNLQPGDSDLEPRALAQLATRAELRQPGLLERALGAEVAAPLDAGSLLIVLALAVSATPIAQQFLGGIDYEGVLTDPREDSSVELEFDYEDLGYETPAVEYFVDRNGVAL
jgi:hypothetical protein